MTTTRRRMTVVALTAMVGITLLTFTAGIIATNRQHHKTLLSAGRYLEECAFTRSRPSLRSIEQVIQGNTTRSVSANSDGTYLVVYDWKILGILNSNKRLYIHVQGDMSDDPTLLSLSRDPI